MNIQRIGAVLVWLLNAVYWLARQPVRFEVLDLIDPQTQQEHSALEQAAYASASIGVETEGVKFFDPQRMYRGWPILHQMVGLGVRRDGQLIAALTAFEAAQPSLWTPVFESDSGLVTQAQQTWAEQGSHRLPVVVYRKIIRHPKQDRFLYQTGAWRLLLAGFTAGLSFAAPRGWVLTTRAQPDTVNILQKHVPRAFPASAVWLNQVDPDSVAGARNTMIFFPTLQGIRPLGPFFKGLLGFTKFGRKKKMVFHRAG